MSAIPLKIHQPDKSNPFDPGPLTVAQVIGWYRSNNLRGEVSPDGQKERERIWGLFCAAAGGRLVSDCKPATLLEWINTQKGVRAANTRRRLKAVVARPFNFAAQMGLIAFNPFAGLKFPQGAHGRDWEAWEYQSLLRHAPAHVRRFLAWVKFSGMRPGEIRLMEWTDIDLVGRSILLRYHKTFHLTGKPRLVPINSVMLKILAYLARRRPKGTAAVFLNAWGNPWTCRCLVDRLDAVRKRAGVSNAVKMHGGRHTFATGAICNGVDLVTLAQLLGHASIQMTQRYVHLARKQAHLKAAMEQAVKGG